MTLSPSGILFAGSRNEGKVYAMKDANNDFVADEVLVVAEDLHMPTGVSFHNGDLYVSEVSRILVFRNIEANLTAAPKPEVLAYTFPDEEHHGPGNSSISVPTVSCTFPWALPATSVTARAKTNVLPPSCGSTPMAKMPKCMLPACATPWVLVHPVTKELWFTENGRDWMGDDIPPCELNHAPKPGLHFGFPYCHGGTLLDPEYGKGKNCADFTPPVQNLAPRGPLGMTFYTGAISRKIPLAASLWPSTDRGTADPSAAGNLRKTGGQQSRFVRSFCRKRLQENGERPAVLWHVLQLPDGSLR